MAEITHVIQCKKTKKILHRVCLNFYNKLNGYDLSISDWIVNHLDLSKEYIITEQKTPSGFIASSK